MERKKRVNNSAASFKKKRSGEIFMRSAKPAKTAKIENTTKYKIVTVIWSKRFTGVGIYYIIILSKKGGFFGKMKKLAKVFGLLAVVICMGATLVACGGVTGT